MKLFIDSADIDEIKDAIELGILDGVTTNPSLIRKAVKKHKEIDPGLDMDRYIRSVLEICRGKSVSLEVIGTTFEEMVTEGELLFKKYNRVAKNVCVKIPVNPCLRENCEFSSDGIKAISYLSKKGIPVNATLIFTPEQALLAGKAGAKFVSPFMGRIDDHIRSTGKVKFDKKNYFPKEGMKKGTKILNDDGIVSGVDLVARCVSILRNAHLSTEVLAASIRNKRQFREAAEVGSHVATVPYSVMRVLVDHPLSAKGMKGFVDDIVPEYSEVLQK
jgi:transaldolase